MELEIEQRLNAQEAKLERLEKITGVSRHTLHLLCAEVGLDLSRFPDASHLASWAGVCPGRDLRVQGSARVGERVQLIRM